MKNFNDIPHYGDITPNDYNKLATTVERSQLTGTGLLVNMYGNGVNISLPQGGFWAQIVDSFTNSSESSSSGKGDCQQQGYFWNEIVWDGYGNPSFLDGGRNGNSWESSSSGTFVQDGIYNPAFEVNGKCVPNDTVVWLYPGAGNEFLFSYPGCNGNSGCQEVMVAFHCTETGATYDTLFHHWDSCGNHDYNDTPCSSSSSSSSSAMGFAFTPEIRRIKAPEECCFKYLPPVVYASFEDCFPGVPNPMPLAWDGTRKLWAYETFTFECLGKEGEFSWCSSVNAVADSCEPLSVTFQPIEQGTCKKVIVSL